MAIPFVFFLGLVFYFSSSASSSNSNYALSALAPTSLYIQDPDYCPVFYQAPPTGCRPAPLTFLDGPTAAVGSPVDNGRVLEDTFSALAVLQNSYFDARRGTWPSSIDWTGAVIETILAGLLATLTTSLSDRGLDAWKSRENLISSLYAQLVHSYFGQNALAIMGEAFDDMLWVVLGWLEAIKFALLHAQLHYPDGGSPDDCGHIAQTIDEALQTLPWQGHDWICAFADRSRGFWDLASAGWDTKLCHGGMIWNPHLQPYKNAITNELWIAASITMYQHFPGDHFNDSWVASKGFPVKNPVYLAAAVEGYRWLKEVNMTNHQGLYVDGYHVNSKKPGNVECDIRNEVVYTYNQGVILTGQRGLWVVTGSPSYLSEGHKLIQSVIRATGWDLRAGMPTDVVMASSKTGHLPPWKGLGRAGIMEDECDAGGTCSQDAQTFKAIFFHHFTAFCAPLEPIDVSRGITVDIVEYQRVKAAHKDACLSYLAWVRHNAEAALKTRDSLGRFGMWWGAGNDVESAPKPGQNADEHKEPNRTDYRNDGTQQNVLWGNESRWMPGSRSPESACSQAMPRSEHRLRPIRLAEHQDVVKQMQRGDAQADQKRRRDPNKRGRGRTVETQAGGLALLRTLFELSRLGA